MTEVPEYRVVKPLFFKPKKQLNKRLLWFFFLANAVDYITTAIALTYMKDYMTELNPLVMLFQKYIHPLVIMTIVKVISSIIVYYAHTRARMKAKYIYIVSILLLLAGISNLLQEVWIYLR